MAAPISGRIVPFVSRLDLFIGKLVNVFGPPDHEDDGFLGGGYVTDVVDGFVFVADAPGETPVMAFALSHIAVIAVTGEVPDLKPIPGGKVHRLRPSDRDK